MLAPPEAPADPVPPPPDEVLNCWVPGNAATSIGSVTAHQHDRAIAVLPRHGQRVGQVIEEVAQTAIPAHVDRIDGNLGGGRHCAFRRSLQVRPKPQPEMAIQQLAWATLPEAV